MNDPSVTHATFVLERSFKAEPSTVFAAYNRYAGPRSIEVWPYNGHEGGQMVQQLRRYRCLADLGIAP